MNKAPGCRRWREKYLRDLRPDAPLPSSQMNTISPILKEFHLIERLVVDHRGRVGRLPSRPASRLPLRGFPASSLIEKKTFSQNPRI
jgi:hypothetical protein